MDIVIALLLLIGGFALGSTASTYQEGGGYEHVEARTEQTSTAPAAASLRAPCRYVDGPLVQRDLTVPRTSAVPLTGNTVEESFHVPSDD